MIRPFCGSPCRVLGWRPKALPTLKTCRNHRSGLGVAGKLQPCPRLSPNRGLNAQAQGPPDDPGDFVVDVRQLDLVSALWRAEKIVVSLHPGNSTPAPTVGAGAKAAKRPTGATRGPKTAGSPIRPGQEIRPQENHEIGRRRADLFLVAVDIGCPGSRGQNLRWVASASRFNRGDHSRATRFRLVLLARRSHIIQAAPKAINPDHTLQPMVRAGEPIRTLPTADPGQIDRSLFRASGAGRDSESK